MASAYTPGLELRAKTIVKKLRELPLLGEVMVKVGDKVKASDNVLSASLPGDLQIIRLSDRMSMELEDLLPGIKVKENDQIKKGDLLCEVKTFFGLFSSKLESPTSGTVEFITLSNAHIGIRKASTPLKINAYISGTVVEVEEKKSVLIETHAALIQGIFGVGGERQGEIMVLDELARDKEVSASDLESYGEKLKGKIVFAGASFNIEALRAAEKFGVAALVTGSIDAETLASFVGYEIGVSITGDEDLPFTLIITEGFGNLPISEQVLELAKAHTGRKASLNGATQVRAGAMRPEVIIPHEDSTVEDSKQELKTLEIGSRVRVIRVPYFGMLGTVSELPHEPQEIESGAIVRVLHTKLDSGEIAIVPRANVELV